MRPELNQAKTGDCECCDRVNVAVIRRHNTWMCSECTAKEDVVIQAQTVINEARKADASLEIKEDIWNAATVSFKELFGAILNDSAIPDAQKDYALVREANERIKAMRAVIIEGDQIQVKRKNELHQWLTQTQEVAARVRGEFKDKIKQYDLSYEPIPQRTPKSRPVPSVQSNQPTKSELKKQINDAAAKYGIDASYIRMKLLSPKGKGQTPEDAAKELAGLVK